MTIAFAGAVVAAAAALWRYVLRQRRLLHLLQLEHYENARLFVWLRRRHELVPWPEVAAEILASIAAVALSVADLPYPATVLWVMLTVGLLLAARPDMGRHEIKPLVFTPRARRLFGAAMVPPALALVAGLVLSLALDSDIPMGLSALATVLAVALAAPLLAAANDALRPVERRINDRFVAMARARLARVAPRVIGVTGSYGKTTTKMCIGAVLGEREPTLITPASFNSYLGVVRAINENLADEHRNFVVEMGMYRAGDIAELCELVGPRIGVITAIGPVHLERLGSIEAIADAKAELAFGLTPDGHLIVNGDDPRCVAIAERAGVQSSLYGLENPDARVRAENVRLSEGRTHFELVIGGRRTPVVSKLLGTHNVGNLLAAAAVGDLVGMPVEDIKRGLEKAEPPEHRLQPIQNPAAGIVVIDDAYNSNPAGAASALEVLKAHPAKRRILVTPGMVELGDQEEALNERLGRQAAEVCDHVILVGPTRTRPIQQGLRAAGFDPDAITIVHDLGAVTQVLAGLTRAGDVVLFENDLPDMYAEENVQQAA